MAMHPKLKEGSILLYYPEIRETTYHPNFNNYTLSYGERWITKPAYQFTVKALYVNNRRSRTNGATVPRELEPYLNALKIRIKSYRSNSSTVTAVGCRAVTIYEELIHNEPDITQAFRKAFGNAKELFQNMMGDNVFENEFIEEYLSKKMHNKQKKMVLFTPVERLGNYYTVKEIKPLTDDNIWPKRLDG